jgi:dTMP kinase
MRGYSRKMAAHPTANGVRAIEDGFLIVFEGIDGAGKTTLATRLCDSLRVQGWPVTASREPNGGTALGQELRRILKDGRLALDAWAESFLFEADRSQTRAEVIAPALSAGGIVVSDRGPFGTIAYQGYGRGLDLSLIAAMNQVAWPRRADIVFVIDVDPAIGLSRKSGGQAPDRFEGEGVALLRRAREGYLAAARLRGVGTYVIDGNGPGDDAFREVWARTEETLAGVSPRFHPR